MSVRTALRPALVACALLAAGPASAELPPDVDAVAAHMGFLGYQCERTDAALQCRHQQHVNTQLRTVQGGTLMITYFATEEASRAPEKRLEVLELVNAMNANSASVIFFIDADGDLGASTWFPGGYEKARFGQIVERWNLDLREALQRDPERSRALIR